MGLLALWLLSAATVSAAVIEQDWQTPHDGLLTYDTVIRSERLELPLTRISSLPGGYPGVVAETGLRAMFDVFTVGRSTDVIALADSVGIDTATSDLATTLGGLNVRADLVGRTVTFGGTLSFLDEINDAPDLLGRLVARIARGGQQAGLFLSTEDSAFYDPGTLDRNAGV